MESLADITVRTLYISMVAAGLAFLASLTLNLYLMRISMRIANLIAGFFEALIGVPTTVIGLLIYMLFFPGGPLGPLRILYTPIAIIIGEFLVALPIAFTSMFKHMQTARINVNEIVLALGLPKSSTLTLMLREVTPVLISSYLMSFSRAVGELGVALIAGGGIEGHTNVFTTAIAMQASIGNYEYAIQIGAVLLIITLAIIIPVKLLGEHIYGTTS